MPGRPVGHQRIPAFRTPAFRDPVPLEDNVFDPMALQMRTHRKARLASAHDEGIDCLSCHAPQPHKVTRARPNT